MRLIKLGPNITELVYKDGTRVLVSYEIPVAACVYAAYPQVNKASWMKTRRFVSRSSMAHVKEWLRLNDAVENVMVVEQQVLEQIMGVY